MNWPSIYAWDIVHDRINGLKLLDSNLLQLNPVGSSIFKFNLGKDKSYLISVLDGWNINFDASIYIENLSVPQHAVPFTLY